MADPDYPYRPLNLPTETRVLTVSPGKFGDPLICSLSHTSIASPDEPYEALSYCWSQSVMDKEKIDPDLIVQVAAYGKEDDGTLVSEGGEIAFKDMLDHPYYGANYIRMGGALPDALILIDDEPITVGGELYRALRHLRNDDEPRRIWVDALCINQYDIAERNDHVRIMGQIYANASHVRIWLGDEIGIEMGFVETLRLADSILYDLLITQGLLEKGGSLGEIQSRFVNSAEAAKLDWEKIAEFVDRAWVGNLPVASHCRERS